MNLLRKCFFLLILSTAFLSAQTQISEGNVSGTWTKANSPYVINGNIDIPINASLTIEPGTSVYFTGEYEFNVHGQLLAEGTESDSILFFSDSLGRRLRPPYDLEYPFGFWYGITFHATDSSNQATSVLKYCRISYAYERWIATGQASLNFNRRFGGGLIFYKSKIDISNTRIDSSYTTGNSIIGIYSSGLIDSISIVDAGTVELLHSDVDIVNSRLEQGKGIALDHATSNIINTKIVNNPYYFISSRFGAIQSENSDVNILNCEINNNAGMGLNAFQSTVKILRTDISGNNGHGAFFVESPATIINCNVRNNLDNGLTFNSSTLWTDTTFIADIQNTIVAKNGGAGMHFMANNGANIKNCVIADNTSPYSWGGIKTGNTDLCNSTNTIVYNNGSSSDFQAGGLYRYSIVQGNYVGSDTDTTNLQNYDPLFRDATNCDYRLKTTESTYFYDSPGIDAGDPQISDWLLDTESAGLGTSRSDIGAYGGGNNWWNTELLPPCHFKDTVSGTWGCERIYVDGDIFIPEGDTLEILPSVDWVLFSGPYEIKVEGVLIAYGTEEREIKFQGTTIPSQAWHGIVFNSINTRTSGASVLEYCRFDYTNKIGTSFPNGGALCIYNSDNVWVKDCYFYNNNARLGGAIYIELSDPRIESCIFKVNGRKHSDDIEILTSAGGAMYIKDSTPYMHDLQFSRNGANDGAAIFLEHSSPKISNTLIVENFASGFAGAIFISNSSPHIVNMTSAENTALAGGSFSLMNASSHPTVINSIMFGNSKPEIYINDGVPTVTYSILDSASTESYFGTGCLTDDPIFNTNGSHQLTSTSPAIDAGHPDSVDTSIDTYTGRGTERADMGYYGGALTGVTTAIIDLDADKYPTEYSLQNNYPNPFNPTTTISYILPRSSTVELSVYSLTGQKIQTLINQEQAAGSYALTFDASNLASGVYFYRLNVIGKFSQVNKMILLK